MQVAERGVVDAVEDRRGHVAHAADPDVALALADLPAGDPGVREHDGAGGARGQVGPDGRHRGAEHGGVAALLDAEDAPDGLRLEVGQPVDRHLPVLVGQQHRRPDVLRPGADVHAGVVDQPGGDAEPGGRVVVAARDDDPRPRVAQPEERVVVQRHGLDRRHGAVVDVTGDQHDVDPLLAHGRHQVVQEGGLRRPQVGPVQGPAEVPVGGVEQAHERTVGRPSDSSRARHGSQRPHAGAGTMGPCSPTPRACCCSSPWPRSPSRTSCCSCGAGRSNAPGRRTPCGPPARPGGPGRCATSGRCCCCCPSSP